MINKIISPGRTGRQLKLQVLPVDIILALAALALKDRFSFGKKRIKAFQEHVSKELSATPDGEIWEKILEKEDVNLTRLKGTCERMVSVVGGKGQTERQRIYTMLYGSILGILYMLYAAYGFRRTRLEKMTDHFYIYAYGIIHKEYDLYELFECVKEELNVDTMETRRMNNGT